MVLTLGLCVVYGSQNKWHLSPYTTLTDWFCINEVESVYCMVQTESLCKNRYISYLKGLYVFQPQFLYIYIKS